MGLVIHKQISEAIKNLSLKLERLDTSNLNISDYNQNYLKRYKDNYHFYMSIYAQLLQKSLTKLTNPITESAFVDYGGGCGMLSYLAKEIGFKHVIYNDMYQTSVDDTKIISKNLDISIDYFICGDVVTFVNEINQQHIKPNLICSFDVLEHIYNLEDWFKSISKINSPFSLLFMTHANSCNPYITNRLKKLQVKAEHQGLDKTFGWKEIDLNSAYIKARENIIRKAFPKLNDKDVKLLTVKTRGLKKEDIEKVVAHFIKIGAINYQLKHPTNTCDPYNGNWTENLIDLKELKEIIKKNNMEIAITNSFYGYSSNKFFNIPKYILNNIIKILGPTSLFLSPTYTLEIEKKAQVPTASARVTLVQTKL